MDRESKGIFRYIIFGVVAVLLLKLFFLQVVNIDYKSRAKNNVVKSYIEYPSRGLIIDRNGKVIVYNEPVYDLYIHCKQASKIDTTSFCKLLNISKEEYIHRFDKSFKKSPRKPIVFIKNISQNNFAPILEYLHQFPGFSYELRTIRRYPFEGAAHVLGYISEVDSQLIKKSKGFYRPGDYAGTVGLEKYYEDSLRGKKGLRNIVVDVFNNPQGPYNDGAHDIIPKTGANLLTGIDIDLQVYGEKLMKNKVGSVVAIEPASGDILSYISSPAYDPNLLTGRYRGHNYKALLSDSLKPLFNRPINAEYPPGSTFKPIMSLIAYQEGVKRPLNGYNCIGGYQIPGHFLKCHSHDLILSGRDAIRFSCNAYYCDALKRMFQAAKYNNTSEAYNKWREYLYSFGYGQKLGVDMEYEKGGNVPASLYYDALYGKNRWRATTVISLSIGQGELLATPLQMANTMAAIANRGFYKTPHILRGHYINDTTYRVINYRKNNTLIEAEFFSPVINGMYDVVKEGTASWLYKKELSICGKTGTAENPHGDDHSLFVAFAPKEDPQIAIAVIVENAGYGSDYAAPIATLMIEKYLNDSIPEGRKWIEQKMLKSDLVNN